MAELDLDWKPIQEKPRCLKLWSLKIVCTVSCYKRWKGKILVVESNLRPRDTVRSALRSDCPIIDFSGSNLAGISRVDRDPGLNPQITTFRNKIYERPGILSTKGEYTTYYTMRTSNNSELWSIFNEICHEILPPKNEIKFFLQANRLSWITFLFSSLVEDNFV